MGEKQNRPFQLSFNGSLKVDFQGSRVTSDGGLLLVRELDERLGLSELISEYLTDGRRGKNTRQSIELVSWNTSLSMRNTPAANVSCSSVFSHDSWRISANTRQP